MRDVSLASNRVSSTNTHVRPTQVQSASTETCTLTSGACVFANSVLVAGPGERKCLMLGRAGWKVACDGVS